MKSESLPNDGGFIVTELGTYSREIVTIKSGNNLQAGAVLGKIGGSGADAGKYAPFNNGAADGTEVAAGILFGDTDASSADTEATGFVRGPAEVKDASLVFDAGQDANAQAAAKADLAALNIVLR